MFFTVTQKDMGAALLRRNIKEIKIDSHFIRLTFKSDGDRITFGEEILDKLPGAGGSSYSFSMIALPRSCLLSLPSNFETIEELKELRKVDDRYKLYNSIVEADTRAKVQEVTQVSSTSAQDFSWDETAGIPTVIFTPAAAISSVYAASAASASQLQPQRIIETEAEMWKELDNKKIKSLEILRTTWMALTFKSDDALAHFQEIFCLPVSARVISRNCAISLPCKALSSVRTTSSSDQERNEFRKFFEVYIDGKDIETLKGEYFDVADEVRKTSPACSTSIATCQPGGTS